MIFHFCRFRELRDRFDPTALPFSSLGSIAYLGHMLTLGTDEYDHTIFSIDAESRLSALLFSMGD
jgi:hypothetical protein